MTREEAIHTLNLLFVPCASDGNKWGCKRNEALDMAIEALQREPILCKECSHAERADTPLTAMWCRRFNLHDMAVGEDDYCSFGERREP